MKHWGTHLSTYRNDAATYEVDSIHWHSERGIEAEVCFASRNGKRELVLHLAPESEVCVKWGKPLLPLRSA